LSICQKSVEKIQV